jgi:hypothetical protein
MRGKAGLKNEKSAKLLCQLASKGDSSSFDALTHKYISITKKEENA